MKQYKTEPEGIEVYAQKYILDKKKSDTIQGKLDEIKKIEEEMRKTQEALDQRKIDLETLSTNTDAWLDARYDVMGAEDHLNDLDIERAGLQESIDRFVKGLKPAVYDKIKLRDNIRNYVEMNDDILYGNLEKDSGYSTGGFSRWGNNIATTELPLSFVINCAKVFGVTIEELLYGDPLADIEADEGVLEFMRRLRDLSKDGVVHWEKIEPRPSNLRRKYDKEFDGGPEEFEMKRKREMAQNRLYKDAEGIQYTTDYEDDYHTIKTSYRAKLPESNDVVCLYNVTTDVIFGEDVLELFIVVDNDTKDQMLYSTLNSKGSTSEAVLKELYSVAEKSSKELVLSDSARNSMSRLINYGKNQRE